MSVASGPAAGLRPISRRMTFITSGSGGWTLPAIMGTLSFSETIFLLVARRRPAAEELRLADAMLVALIEHGLTPGAMVARVTYSVAPESLQGAVGGLLGAGSVVLGSMEECGSY